MDSEKSINSSEIKKRIVPHFIGKFFKDFFGIIVK